MNWVRKLLFLPEQSSTFARKVDVLHAFMIGTTMLVAVGIGAAGLYFLVRYRRRSEQDATPHLEAPRWVEGLFVGAPLSLFLLWFGLGFRDFVWLQSPPADALDVYVTGKQWMWKFSYPEGPSGIDVLRVPAGRPVRLLLTSRDVIHSFFVPDFRIKQDAVPGRYTQTWFEVVKPGRHEILCAEYCGMDHSRMRGVVEALAPADFERWREAARRGVVVADEPGGLLPGETLAARGEREAAGQGCLLCHSVDGRPHIGPTWRGLYGREERLEGGGTVLADEGYLTESMMDPLAKVVAGFAPVMPSYHGRLSAAQAGALVEFIKSLRARPGERPREEPTYVPTGR
ncbi:cytochrome c oxidase subunit II [Myxococcaceae bacterium GXIMD 01537]